MHIYKCQSPFLITENLGREGVGEGMSEWVEDCSENQSQSHPIGVSSKLVFRPIWVWESWPVHLQKVSGPFPCMLRNFVQFLKE
jgi:hypothetical protein